MDIVYQPIITTDKAEKYQYALQTIELLFKHEQDFIANTANICAILKSTFNWHWIGFYWVDAARNNELVLGTFQGPLACTRIPKGKGVCGTAWQKNETIIVPNVHEFPGHIACSSLTNSEIVVPIHNASGKVIGVIDADSILFSDFDATDKSSLIAIADCISQNL